MGAGYTLSWDIVTWLEKNPMEEFRNWDEDQMIGAMMKEGNRGLNFVDLGDKVMDEPTTTNTGWSREYGDDVILVHRLKNIHLFGTAIDFFWGKNKDQDQDQETTKEENTETKKEE